MPAFLALTCPDDVLAGSLIRSSGSEQTHSGGGRAGKL